MTRFKGRIESARGGGHYIAIPTVAAKKAELAYRMRVRGTLGGVAYRSSLMKQGDSFCLGVHKATLAKASVATGDVVTVEIEADREPLPDDTVPEILARALAENRAAGDAFAKLAPSHRREHVRYIGEAKKAETQAARVAKTVAMLLAKPPTPKSSQPKPTPKPTSKR